MHHLVLPLLILLALLLLVAATTDISSRVIPNALNLVVALLAVPWWFATGLTGAEMGVQLIIASVVLAVFAGCFAIGMMGGGDVKLIAALALWLPLPQLMTMLVWMAIAGGVLTLAMLIVHRSRRSARALEIPYGVAIAAASLMLVANDMLTLPAA